MVWERLAAYRDHAHRKLVAAVRENHTPRQVAVSFAIGVFITAFPTGGLGIGLFFVFASLWSWISKPAIFAAAAVLNPFVKPAVYLASFQTGALLLGSDSVRSRDATTAESAWVGLRQLLLGNVLVAIVLAVLGYVLVLQLTRLYRRRTRRETDSSDTSLRSLLLESFRRQ